MATAATAACPVHTSVDCELRFFGLGADRKYLVFYGYCGMCHRDPRYNPLMYCFVRVTEEEWAKAAVACHDIFGTLNLVRVPTPKEEDHE